ncbi:MAG TPA: DUF4870 domain-containing protein [Candidatus Acidoferrales bacterium]
MPFCSKCGTSIDVGTAFCPSCGAPQGATTATAPPAGAASSAPAMQQTGLAENVAGALCYLFGWVTGLIFFLIDKRPYVRFHAAQSIVVFGGLNIISFILSMAFGMSMFGFGGFSGVGLGLVLFSILNIVVFVLWILLMVKAYQGQRFRVPVAADLAEQIFGKA